MTEGRGEELELEKKRLGHHFVKTYEFEKSVAITMSFMNELWNMMKNNKSFCMVLEYNAEPLEGVNKIAKTIENKGFSRKGKADGKNFVRWKPLHILERCKEKRQGKTAVRHGLGIVFKL